MSKIYSIDAKEYSPSNEISVLFVGNSLTQDGIAYLPYLLKTYYPGISFRFYIWYVGGFTLAQHYNYFTTNHTCSIFSRAENAASWTNQNSAVTMSSILSTYKFDVVCVQEYFNEKTSYTETTDLENCIEYIRSNYRGGNSLKFITLFHAPLRSNADNVFELTKESIKLILKTTLCEDVLANGIAVYDALSTELDSLGDQGHLSPDGLHTQEGLPCLLQTFVSLLWFLEKNGFNESIYGSSARITTAVYETINVPGPNLGSGVISGTDAQNLLAQEIAIQAYKKGKLLVSNSDEIDDIKQDLTVLEPSATALDIGKALKVKSVSDGKVSEYEFGDTVSIDDTLTHTGMAADAKAVGDELTTIKDDLLTTEIKQALLDCFYKVAWSVSDGLTYYNNLQTALYGVSYPLITATFSPGNNIVKTTDNLSTLKQYITVVYFETRSSTGVTIPSADWSLNGVLTSGTSNLLVTYGNISTNVVIDNVADTWSWSSSSSIMAIRAHSITSPASGQQRRLKVTTPSVDNRHVAVCTTGSLYYYDAEDESINKNICPFPVPATATSFTVRSSNSAHKIVGYLFKHVGDQLCETINLSDATWKTQTHVSSGFAAQKNLYLGVCINHTTGAAPGTVTVTFS